MCIVCANVSVLPELMPLDTAIREGMKPHPHKCVDIKTGACSVQVLTHKWAGPWFDQTGLWRGVWPGVCVAPLFSVDTTTSQLS